MVIQAVAEASKRKTLCPICGDCKTILALRQAELYQVSEHLNIKDVGRMLEEFTLKHPTGDMVDALAWFFEQGNENGQIEEREG